MSTKKKSKKSVDRNFWPQTMAHNRAGVMKVLADIERGELDTQDLERLRNFCLFALKLMQERGPEAWEEAKHRAEIDEIVEMMEEKQ